MFKPCNFSCDSKYRVGMLIYLYKHPVYIYRGHVQIRAIPDFGSGSGRNPALFPNPVEIWLWLKSHRSRLVLPDLKSIFPRH